ncbi:pentapeptide repeat-containing protein [Oscillatoria sp. CS-180]|uniref:pentapeptide repeat-containing protein n=1 Tax=Oscillatoria sp. CS-180 TaxID=3021720 RepID=UPI00232DE358|nr:pentapeptide repeat-containing protein [Oscillatoria sp. CS-180]MDB9529238.1 pentapeptide repeat-containing protein [Oscillatoria sp. CS-180]
MSSSSQRKRNRFRTQSTLKTTSHTRNKPQDSHQTHPSPTLSTAQAVPTLGRRLLAWGLEVVVFGASIAGPFYLGSHLNRISEAQRTDLSPTLQIVQEGAAKALGLSPRSLPEKVPPLTNLLWSFSLGLPLILAAGHIYSVSRSGRSLPKRWMGVQVLALNGQMPGLRRTLLREGIGKWGSPLLLAYGVWQLSGAFPVVGVLFGLGTFALLGESLTGLGNRPRRAWHDWLAGTCVVDQETGAIIHLSSLWDAEANFSDARRRNLSGWAQAVGPTTVVMNPTRQTWRKSELNFSKIGLGCGLLLVVGGLIGVGTHFLAGRSLIAAQSAEENLYVNLVSTLTNPELDPAARRSAVLALGNLPDDRVTPLLVDLIAQTDDDLWLDALQQALVARGTEAFPYLRRLNQSLTTDLATQGDPTRRRILIVRLQTVNRIVTKLLVLEGSDRPSWLDLSRMHLGYVAGNNSDFKLVLKNQDLSDIQWQGSVMTQAQLQGAKFYSPGADDHPDTYDDRMADLSGADLTDANLTGADLSLSQLVNSGLLRTNLNRANLTLANLSGANLENATLIQAQLNEAQLIEAKLSKADLTEAELFRANLTGARLAEADAAGAQMIGADLQGITARSANLKDSDLSNSSLENADFSGATLQGANLRNADLTGTNLRDTDLRGVWLQGAILDRTDLAGAILMESARSSDRGFVEAVPNLTHQNQFEGVDFSQALNLTPQQISFICTQGGIHPTCSRPTQQ